jgi:hypothetical protein
MKRLERLFWYLGFFFIALPAITSKVQGQQRMPPVLEFGVRPGYSPILLEYPAPPMYEDWWKEIAACEGLPLPPEHVQVQFVALSAREFFPLDDPGWAIGYAHVWSGQLYLAFPYIGDKTIVMHEMLHFLLWWSEGRLGHSEERYGKKDIGKCGVVPYRRVGIDER